jgi:EAL domain-containing protein (putative c-di-GMP-specific phosphodiesterase class I)
MSLPARATGVEGAVTAACIDAVIRDESLTIAVQPIVEVHSGTVLGYEALSRFTAKPLQGPYLWFEDAERVGRRTELELLALRKALDQLAFIPEDCYLSLNASPGTIVSGLLPDVLCVAPLDRLILEVTEEHPIKSYERFGEALRPLRQAGLRLAIDDVGAGFASLKHILRLSPHIVKLDHSLTHAVIPSRSARALAAALTGFAIETGTTVLAEGIETQDQLDLLMALGVSLGQGFLLGRPGPPPGMSSNGRGPAPVPDL